MRAFCWSRDRAQNIADSIWCSFDRTRNQFGLHMLSQMEVQGLIYRISRILHASGNNQSAHDMGWTQSFLPMSLVQNMHLQVLRIIFVLEAVFSLSQYSDVHVNELKNMRTFSQSKDRVQNIVDSIWCSFDCMKNQWGFVKAVFWGRNRNRWEICWTPSTLLDAFMLPELP